ncbi:hypothetical protein DRJ00_01790 [Candidatus Aerophobetes bacterium]|uniref:Uncharacterized protein n=1 Tax=Aerophobetes bacterium TaxID=2030807 RepID=A0A497E5C2_UNCAE|nr:MAG: hypothetical protein DRJ00_01790 [Candidatus Aerophobetes bacterium]
MKGEQRSVEGGRFPPQVSMKGEQRSVEGVIPKEWAKAYVSPLKCRFNRFYQKFNFSQKTAFW